ncbi:hypothetical protein WA026_018911 [Henosepilachna vigintioctopunctata]|uniref:Lipase n=1 Tax=Henosepilachna vigintioctopunctata TaxID=420089 RepID=A0AAW1UQE2_9CUCU
MVELFYIFYIFLLLSEVVESRMVHPDFHLCAEDMIKKYGYPVETHEVTTMDGYMLTMFRIPHGKKEKEVNQKPILLMHGLFGQAENYIIAGMNNASLAYFLADNGFDVWLGNTRGSQHGRQHKTMDPNGRRFWDFSYHEIGVYDLPAKIDYILQKTSKEKIHYIGHSQGGTTFYIMTSEKPEYQRKIVMATLLAPAGYMNHFANPLLLPLVKTYRELTRVVENIKLYELPPKRFSLPSVLDAICRNDVLGELCTLLYHVIINGGNSGEFNEQMLPLVIKYIPSVSIKQPLHYAQEILSGNFRKFDFGRQGNLRKYKVMQPPKYNLRNITTPVAIFYSQGDTLVNKKDAEETCEALSNCVKKFLMPNPKWTHLDFVFAINGRKLLHKPILNLLNKYNQI